MINTRSLTLNSPMAWVVGLVTLAFFFLGLRTLLFPVSAAAFYGVPTSAPEAFAFVQAYGARNVALSLLGATLIVLDVRKGIVALFALAGLIAAADAWIVTSYVSLGAATKHFIYIVVLESLAVATEWTGRADMQVQMTSIA